MGRDNRKNISQQKSTPINSFIDPYEKLNLIHQKSVDLRLEGMKFKDIAKEVGVKEQTVRSWFMRGGICYEAYEFMKKERMKEREDLFKQIDKRLKDIAVDAVIVLENAVRKGNWKAAVKVLEMAGFEPVHKIADVTEDEKKKTLEILKDFFINGRQNQSSNKPIQDKQQTDNSNPSPKKDI